MSSKSILPLLLVMSSWGFGQGTATSPSKKELLNQLETAAPASQPRSVKETGTPVTPPKTQSNPGSDPSLGTIVSAGLNQHVAPATSLSNDELLVRGKTIYVITESFFVKKEQLEKGLINRKELGEWGIHVVSSFQNADLILRVKRLPFQNNFPFTLTDRVSGIVVMGGTVNSLFGTVAGRIAGRLADKLKEIKTKSSS
ncbi:MAG TPA: hypothetical protein VKY85_08945 [Candidatus Angelobacter sp.]|nr:hypothetical protein [Candidatus Angelobacter sp.]